MERQVSCSVAHFAARFCNEMGTNKTSICSPLCAEMPLALLALGCKGQAREELLKALNMSDDEAIRSSFTFLTSTLKSVKGVSLNVANKVYLKQGAELMPGIKKDAKKVFQASLKQLDFSDNEGTSETINKWVAKKTKNMIKDIVTPDMINDLTRILLVNAIYFQGFWANKFTGSKTKNWDFKVNATTTIRVPMMSTEKKKFNYAVSQELEARLLQMKYKWSDASMIIVLPNEVEGLNSVLQKLASGHDIVADMENMKQTKFEKVRIPKFRVETTIDLKTLLPKLGINVIFDENNTDIDMLESHERLFVSHAIQKAVIIVDEDGTEAAASTANVVQNLCLREPIKVRQYFVANRPFLYLLTAGKVLLFIGVYEGSEYAEAPSDGLINSQILLREELNREMRNLQNINGTHAHNTPLHDIRTPDRPDNGTFTHESHDTPIHYTPTHDTFKHESHDAPIHYTPSHDITTQDALTHNTLIDQIALESHRTSNGPVCTRCEIQ